MVLFSVVSVCVFVCLFVCLSLRQYVNTITPEPLEMMSDVLMFFTKFSGHHAMIERSDKFENGYIEVRGWWFNVSDVLVLSCKWVPGSS